MALITFQDLPNTTTPLNATNLNNNFNYLNTRASITLTEGADGTGTSAFGTVACPTESQFASVEGNFTRDGNAVKVVSGVSLVRVSGVVCGQFTNNSTTTDYEVGARIIKNGTAQNVVPRLTIKKGETQYVTIPITPYITSATANDLFQIGIYSSTGNVTKTPKTGTYICVEQVK